MTCKIGELSFLKFFLLSIKKNSCIFANKNQKIKV